MSNDEQNHVSRHRFLHSLGLAGVAGAGGSLLVACGEGSQAACTDLSALSAQQKEQRKKMVKSLQYVKESPKEGKYCSNCSQYVKSEFGETVAGGARCSPVRCTRMGTATPGWLPRAPRPESRRPSAGPSGSRTGPDGRSIRLHSSLSQIPPDGHGRQRFPPA